MSLWWTSPEKSPNHSTGYVPVVDKPRKVPQSLHRLCYCNGQAQKSPPITPQVVLLWWTSPVKSPNHSTGSVPVVDKPRKVPQSLHRLCSCSGQAQKSPLITPQVMFLWWTSPEKPPNHSTGCVTVMDKPRKVPQSLHRWCHCGGQAQKSPPITPQVMFLWWTSPEKPLNHSTGCVTVMDKPRKVP